MIAEISNILFYISIYLKGLLVNEIESVYNYIIRYIRSCAQPWSYCQAKAD